MRRADPRILHGLAGAVVVSAFAALVYWAYAAQPGGGSGYDIAARFSRVDGITEGSEVRLVGLPVGIVTSMRYDPEHYQATLVLRIRKGVPLPVDSSAAIISDSVLGGKYVKLDPGGAVEMMADGDIIDFTQDSVIFEDVLERVVTGAERRLEERRRQEQSGEKP